MRMDVDCLLLPVDFHFLPSFRPMPSNEIGWQARNSTDCFSEENESEDAFEINTISQHAFYCHRFDDFAV